MPMKYIISVLLLLSTLQVIAHEWNTYQYKDKYSVSVPSTIELRRENDTYTQLLNDIQGNIIGFHHYNTHHGVINDIPDFCNENDGRDHHRVHAHDIHIKEQHESGHDYVN